MARSKPITIPISRQSLTEFFSHLQVSTVNYLNGDPCWDWTAALDVGGYAKFSHHQRKFKGHRVSYTWFRGSIPEGLVLDHLCRNRICVNPNHLEIVTIGENVLRGETIPVSLALRTHCEQGHEFTLENTGRKHGRGGTYYRTCKTCHCAQARDNYRRNAEARRAQKREYKLLRKAQRIS